MSAREAPSLKGFPELFSALTLFLEANDPVPLEHPESFDALIDREVLSGASSSKATVGGIVVASEGFCGAGGVHVAYDQDKAPYDVVYGHVVYNH